MNKQTPLQQIKDNYYKMNENQFHSWVAQNRDRLVQEEKEQIRSEINEKLEISLNSK